MSRMSTRRTSAKTPRFRSWVIAWGFLIPMFLLSAPSTATIAQNDAGSNSDAGDSLEAATPVTPYGLFSGDLVEDGTDPNDYYSFDVQQGKQINIEIREVLLGGSLIATDNHRRMGFRLLGPQGVLLDTPTTNQGDTRVAIAAAPLSGTYYFQVSHLFVTNFSYKFCFLHVSGSSHSCPDLGLRPIDAIFGGSLKGPKTRVLLVPPTHGDLGNPINGPSLQDYLTTTVNAIHEWEPAIDLFIADHPEFKYLDKIDIEVAIFDGVMPTDDFDVGIVFVESGGTGFRGVASPCLNTPRCIALSLFSSSPRGGQLIPDYPELNDLDAVVKHEFAHTFGLGHTLTWTSDHGPDLMNSPAPFVYGDGNPAGDGGERTSRKCISNLDLYGLGKIYQWLDSGDWTPPSASKYSLPSWTYKWYCPSTPPDQPLPGSSSSPAATSKTTPATTPKTSIAELPPTDGSSGVVLESPTVAISQGRVASDSPRRSSHTSPWIAYPIGLGSLLLLLLGSGGLWWKSRSGRPVRGNSP